MSAHKFLREEENKTAKSSKISKDDKSFKNSSLFTSSIAIFKKTLFKDITLRKRFLLSLLFMLIGPFLLFLFIDQSRLNKSNSILETPEILYAVFFFSFSLVFPLLISVFSAPLISSEIYEGTMQTLVSIPIRRTQIFISKFLAVFVYGVFLSFISLSIICIISYLIRPFQDIFIFFFINFLYSLIILFFFESISIGISCLYDKPRIAFLIPLGIILFVFIAFMVIKPLLLSDYYGPSKYETYQIYHFDLNYHFINSFFFLIEIFYSFSDYSNTFLNMFGVVKNGVPTNYWHPLASFVLIISIAFIFMIIGLLRFIKRDINR